MSFEWAWRSLDIHWQSMFPGGTVLQNQTEMISLLSVGLCLIVSLFLNLAKICQNVSPMV